VWKQLVIGLDRIWTLILFKDIIIGDDDDDDDDDDDNDDDDDDDTYDVVDDNFNASIWPSNSSTI